MSITTGCTAGSLTACRLRTFVIRFYINQYIYDDENKIKAIIRICENTNWSNKYTEYIYNSKNQITEINDYEDATIYVNRY